MDTNKPVLVTGAQGFIGRAVTRLLHRESHPVIAVDRRVPVHLVREVGQNSERSAMERAH